MFLGSSLLFIHIYFLFCVLQSVKLSCLKTPHVLVQLGPRLSGQVKGHSDPTLPSPSPSPFPTRAKMATSGALRISLQVLLPVITLLLSLLLTGSNASKYQDLLNFGAFNRFITHICKLIKKWSNHKKGGREGHYISFGEPFFFTLSTSKMLLLHFATAHLYLKIAC